MRRSVVFASILLILALFSLSGANFTRAQSQGGWNSTGWVAIGSLYDLTGSTPLGQGAPLIAGHSYNMTFTVTVPNTSTSTPQYQVSLNNLLQPASGQSLYWAVHSPSYGGYNRTGFTAGDKTVTFNYIQGTVGLSAYFQVPGNFTIPVAKYSTPSGNGTITLHIPQNNVILVSVVPAASTGTGSFSASVEDQTTQAYLNNYNQTASLVPSGKISSTYSGLVNAILNEAQALNKLGLPDQGTTLLGAVVPSSFPTPPSSALQTYLLVGLGVAGFLVIILAILWIRTRSKSGYSAGIINDVQKDLAILEVTAAKYDRAMADKLKSLRDRLSESS